MKIKNILRKNSLNILEQYNSKILLISSAYILFFLTPLFAQTVGQQIKIPIYKINNNHYISAYEYARAHQANIYFDENKKKLEIKSTQSKNIIISQNSSFIMVNEKIYHLFLPVLYQNNDFLIPISAFLNTMKNISGPIGFIDTSNKHLIIDAQRTINIDNLTIKNKTNGMIIHIDTKQKFNDNIISGAISQGWLSITIPGGIIDSTKIVNVKKKYPVTNIRCIQNIESAQISFLINEDVDEFQINSSDNYIKINIRMNTEENIAKIKEKRDKWVLDTIIIDAGHGGKDPGAIGIGGIQEKTITLDVAKRLGALLEENLGITVIYTRDDDTFVPLYKRTKIANESNGKLFISLHANSAKKSHRASGFETYFLRPGKWDDAIEIVKRENAVIQLEADQHRYKDFTDEEHIYGALVQNQIIKDSEFFASQVQLQLDRVLNIKNRGVKQAGFHVLVGAEMPNILIELGFVSNKKDVRLLNKAQDRQKMATAIFRAIKSFKEKKEKDEK